MADYRRLISYLYNYEYNVKKNNIGYVRVESRNGQCKITVHINVLTMNEEALQVCFFLREEGRIKCVVIGEMAAHKGTGEFQTVTASDDLEGTGYGLEEMAGMLLFSTPYKFFGTEWDDEAITIEEFKVAKNRQSKVEAAMLVTADAEEETEAPEAAEEAREPWAAAAEAVVLTEIRTAEVEMEEKAKEEEEDICTVTAEEAEEGQRQRETALEYGRAGFQCREEVKEKEPGSWGEFRGYEPKELIKNFVGYPRISPFEDDEIGDCVRIEPQDIGIFPMECWDLANNSFLLHGYYSYRHLVFAEQRKDNKIRYVIGVPGIFYNREKFMASMFGFDQFKTIKNTEEKTGEFGYWFRPVP